MPDCVIAAAGRSRRMKNWKPALPWGDSTILEAVVQNAADAGCRILLAGGYRFADLVRMFADRQDICVIRARHWRRGMGSTAAVGARHAATGDFFVMAGDMPLVEKGDYVRLVSEFRHRILKEAVAARPSYNCIPGHPVLLTGAAAEALRGRRGFRTVREVLKEFPVLEIPWSHPGVICDIDTSADYEKYRPRGDSASG